MNEEEIKVSWETYIGFPATAGEIEVQGDPQVFKCLQFITEAFSGKLPQGVLVPLGCLFHLPFLQDTWRANTWWGRREPKEKQNNVGERSRPRHPPDTPTIAVLWLKSSLLINHTYNKQTSSDKTRTHTHTNKLHMTGLSFLLQTQSVKCQTSITAPLLSAMKHAHRFIVYIYLSKKKPSFSTPFYKKDWRSHVCVFFKHFIKTGKSSLLSRGISFYFRYLVKQVSFLHQLLKEDDEDVRLWSSHGPSSVPCGSRRQFMVPFSAWTDGHRILFNLVQGKVT